MADDGKILPSKGLGYQIYDVEANKKVVVIVLPKPESMSEAYMVGAVFVDGKRRGISYTLEKGFNRMTLGGWTDNAHLNFGEGPDNDPEKFRDAILDQDKD